MKQLVASAMTNNKTHGAFFICHGTRPALTVVFAGSSGLKRRLAGWVVAGSLGTLWLAGCATYHPRPLPAAPDLAQAPALTVPARQFKIPGLKPHPFPTNGLDETAVVTLAVIHNPGLKAVRLRAGVAAAQLLEAGLLPDPQVTSGLSESALFTGHNLELREDVQALITRGAAKAAAQAHERQVNLEVLWQEWQVAEKARQLFIQSRADNQLQSVLASILRLRVQRYQSDAAALKKHDLTLKALAVDLQGVTNARSEVNRLELDVNRTRHALNQLLGLGPEARLHLLGRSERQPPPLPRFQAALAALSRRRPDLLALKAGYQSQEQRLREAILAQFPAMSAGVEQARSAEEGIHTVGFTVDVSLPLFNRNRGQIAFRRASRALLYQTYQARLDQAVSQADQVWHAARILAGQLADLQARLPELKKVAAAAEQSFRQGNLDTAAYTGLALTFRTEQTDSIRLRASLEQAQAALEILLGLPLRSVVSHKKRPRRGA